MASFLSTSTQASQLSSSGAFIRAATNRVLTNIFRRAFHVRNNSSVCTSNHHSKNNSSHQEHKMEQDSSNMNHNQSYHRDFSSSGVGKGNSIVSQRGANAVKLLPSYLADARSAPEGALQLGVAENYLMQEWLERDLSKLMSKSDGAVFDASQIYYQPTQGREGTRRAMCRFFERILSRNYCFQEDGVVVGAGCNAVLENLAFCLANAGDAVLIPTPYYAAFEFDLVARAGLQIQPVPTFNNTDLYLQDSQISIPIEEYYPTKQSLDAAYNRSIEAGSVPRILLLSSPNNPLGVCYPNHVLLECIEWAEERGIHLISDEIYAGSVYRNPDEDGESVTPWTSVAEVVSQADRPLGPMVHIVYALSKDFALSGLRVGAVYTENNDIILPLQKLNDLCQISSQTQVMVEKMLDPEQNSGWADKFLKESQHRLKQRCTEVENLLDELKIPHLKGEAGLFLWMDFREFLPEISDVYSNERTLYLELLQDYGLLFTPGLSMKTELPGFFRFVFTAAEDESKFKEALQRIRSFVTNKRK